MSGEQIVLQRNNDYSEAHTAVSAKIAMDTPDTGFHYGIANLVKLFQVIEGSVKIELDAKGIMLVKTRSEVYVQSPLLKPIRAVKSKQAAQPQAQVQVQADVQEAA